MAAAQRAQDSACKYSASRWLTWLRLTARSGPPLDSMPSGVLRVTGLFGGVVDQGCQVFQLDLSGPPRSLPLGPGPAFQSGG